MSSKKSMYNEKNPFFLCIRKLTCFLTFKENPTLGVAIYWRFNLETQLSELKNNHTEVYFPLL